jgi:hypothetical protein
MTMSKLAMTTNERLNDELFETSLRKLIILNNKSTKQVIWKNIERCSNKPKFVFGAEGCYFSLFYYTRPYLDRKKEKN